MPGFDILDVAIGTILFFLIVSLLCSSVRELVELALKQRATDLEKGIRQLLPGQIGGRDLVAAFYDHGVISALYDKDYARARNGLRKTLPSYIPSGHFASALIDIVARGPDPAAKAMPAVLVDIAALRANANALPDGVRQAVLHAIDFSGGELTAAKANLEAWYDGTMDRVSGWYKRHTQVWLFVIGLFAALLFNLDALTVFRALETDKALRETAVAYAEAVKPQATDDARQAIKDQRTRLQEIGYPIGWDSSSCPAPQTQALRADPLHPNAAASCADLGPSGWLWIFLGWLITAAGACIGAPAWFDVLNKFMVIRSTVKPREKSGDEGSEDRPSPSPAQTLKIDVQAQPAKA